MKGEMMMLNTADTHDFIDQLTLEGVPWHRLTTPYGRGDELPKLLKDLSSLKIENLSSRLFGRYPTS